MKNSATQSKLEKEIVSPFKNQNELDNYKKETTHLEAAIKNYEDQAKYNDVVNSKIAFKDTLIRQEIIAWHMNLKSRLFDLQ